MEFFLFLIFVATVAVLILAINARNAIRKLHLEVNLLSQRLDYLRKELNKQAAKPQPPVVRAPSPPWEEHAEEPTPREAPLAAATMAGGISAPKIEPWKSLELTPTPPPLPGGKEWTLEPEEEEEEKKTSKLAESAREILGKIWNWILFGAERKPDDVSLEYAIASVWLPRLGATIFVIGIGFFLKWSIARGFLDAQGRVAISVVAGVAMLVSGRRMIAGRYRLIAQGLLGGGLLVMYFSAYAAGPRYNLIPNAPHAFGLMILVTIAAGALAVSADSMLIAVVGIAGGYFTPVMLRTPVPNLPGLYSYILLLSLGILYIAHYKQWRLLNYLGFLLTYAIFYGSIGSAYREEDFPVAMPFLTAFFVVHSFIVYHHNLAKANRSSVLEIAHLVANALVFAWLGYDLIYEAHGRPYPAIMSVGLAGFFIAQVFIFLKKRLMDRPLLLALIALSAMFTAWTLPLIFEKETLTIALAILALAFLWLGMKLRSNLLQNLGCAAYAVLFFRLFFLDLGREFGARPSADQPMAIYWREMVGRLWTFGAAIGSIAGAFFLQLRQPAPVERFAIEAENDVPLAPGGNILSPVFYWAALVFAFLFAHLELNSMFIYCEPLRLPILTLLWCGMAAYFLWRLAREDAPATAIFLALCVFVAGAAAKLFAVDLWSWRMCDRLIYDVEYNFLLAGMRLLDFGLVAAIFLAVWRVGAADKKMFAPLFGYGGLLICFVYASLELNSLLFWKAREFQEGGISVLWAIFAIAFVAGGIWKSVKTLRYAGLALFVIVIAKVFVVDLRRMAAISKVIASIALGGILLLGAFAYLRASKAFLKTGGEPKL